MPRAAGRRTARGRLASGPGGVGSPAAANAGVSRDLARRRAGGRRPLPRARSDLRDAVPAAQVQSRVRLPGRQLLRCALERPGVPGRHTSRAARGIQRVGGRRHGAHARQDGHLSPARRHAGPRQDGGGCRGGGGGGEGAARSRQSQRPAPCPAQVPARQTGTRLVPRSGGAAAPSSARAGRTGRGFGYPGPSRMARAGQRTLLPGRVHRKWAHPGWRRPAVAQRAAPRGRDRRRRRPLHPPAEPAADRHPRPAQAARGPDPGRPRRCSPQSAVGRAPLGHGVPGAPHLRPRRCRGGAGAARCDRGARGRARAAGRGGCGAHGPHDRVSQRVRSALHRRSRLRGSLAAQVRPVRGRQHAGHQAGDALRRSHPARPARRHGPTAVRALPRRATRRRAVRRLLSSSGDRGAARFRPGRLVTFYPVFLNLRGRRAVVIGGGAVAEQKVFGLLAAGAHVTVVSPETTPRLRDLADAGGIELRRRPYRSGDLAGAWLAIAGTDDRAANAQVWAEAEREGVLLNAVDDLDHCSFIAPAIHREGDITIAVSTSGKSPALAARLRQRVARLVGPAEARLCALLGELRPEVAARVPDTHARTILWYRIVDSDVIEFVRRGDDEGARRRIDEMLEESPPVHGQCRAAGLPAHGATGTVYLVGAGPGDPGLITTKGLEILRSADVVVYDRLVAPSLIAEAPPTAERVFVGKSARGAGAEQDDINALLVERARRGLTVVRLKGGDPFVFGRGAEECEALHAAEVPFHVVPGVTSAIAVPAAAGIPVTHRRLASAFAVVTGHECDGVSSLDWEALARVPTLVVLMGLSALREITARLLEHGADPDTPAAVIASGTLPTQRTVVGTLATLAARVAEESLEPPATVVIGEVVRVRELLSADAVGLTHPVRRLVSQL